MTVETIAQHAHRVALALTRKPKKDHLQSIVREMYENDLTDAERLESLALLYTHFMPAAPAKPKTLAQWVARAAAGSKDHRYMVQYVYADLSAGQLVATDGHRLHLMPLPGEGFDQPGFYCPKTLEYLHGVEFATYPAYERIIPNRAECETSPVKPAAWEVGELGNGTVYYKTPYGALNKQYVDAVLAAPGVEFDVIYCREPGNSAVCFAGDADGVLALVMPIKVD